MNEDEKKSRSTLYHTRTHRLNEWYRKCGRNDGNVDKEPRGNPTCQNSLVQTGRKQLLRLATWKVFVLGRLLLGTRNVDTYKIAWLQNTDMARTGAFRKKGGAAGATFFYFYRKRVSSCLLLLSFF